MKMFFCEVQTYLSVGTMMKELGKWVWLHYDRVVVSDTMWKKMEKTIEAKMKELAAKHPRNKPIMMDKSSSMSNDGITRSLWVRPVNNQNDNFSFILTGKQVHSMEMNMGETVVFTPENVAHEMGFVTNNPPLNPEKGGNHGEE